MQTIKIEKLSNLGYGIAKIDGKVIFVPNTCPEDIVEIEIIKQNKNFSIGKLVNILSPSPNRTEPKCKMQYVCGACQLQFIKYQAQLKYKQQVVEDIMKSIYGYDITVKEVIPSPQIYNYRHKIQYPISETKKSERILAGYYKHNSHELINIKYCPIQPEQCDSIIDFIRNACKTCGVRGYVEQKHAGELRHVVIRTTSSGDSLVVLVVNSTYASKSIKQLASKIFNEFSSVKGVIVNFNSEKTNLILGKKCELAEGDSFVKESICNKTFKIGAKTFFQVNPLSADNIFRYVKKHIYENYVNPTILDAYAGITAFGICLSDIAQKIVSVEEVTESVELAQQIINENDITNIELHKEDASKFFKNEVTNKNQYDIVVLDPPRKGCSVESLDYAVKLAKSEIIYVSCNPATLARDMKYLKDNDFVTDFIQPFDMFPHTYHIENVAIFKKNSKKKSL